ncbi:hypothetical protein [Treponema paraluiscuniculi]|uniref:hypothetical protein n=1 Tax=Treponema paraluiscuniculi TaxID=53435 RepID=UPI001FDFCF67|nr:hypothetical protein [Treponema paraluiscuniculi]
MCIQCIYARRQKRQHAGAPLAHTLRRTAHTRMPLLQEQQAAQERSVAVPGTEGKKAQNLRQLPAARLTYPTSSSTRPSHAREALYPVSGRQDSAFLFFRDAVQANTQKHKISYRNTTVCRDRDGGFMQQYSIKSDPGETSHCSIVSQTEDGYIIRICRDRDGYKKVHEVHIHQSLFDLCRRTGFITAVRQNTDAVA